MKRLPLVIGFLVLLALPTGVAGVQFGQPSPRGTLFVYLAFAAAWVIVAAWGVRIGLKVRRLTSRLEDQV